MDPFFGGGVMLTWIEYKMCQHIGLFIKSALNHFIFIMGIGYPYVYSLAPMWIVFFLSKKLLSLGTWESIDKGKEKKTRDDP